MRPTKKLSDSEASLSSRRLLRLFPGTFYVYFVYGMHWMLNVVTGPVGYPAAVLIRGVEGILGPGRLTKALRINGNLNGKAAKKETGVWFSERSVPMKNTITQSSRIGVSYAGRETLGVVPTRGFATRS